MIYGSKGAIANHRDDEVQIAVVGTDPRSPRVETSSQTLCPTIPVGAAYFSHCLAEREALRGIVEPRGIARRTGGVGGWALSMRLGQEVGLPLKPSSIRPANHDPGGTEIDIVPGGGEPLRGGEVTRRRTERLRTGVRSS